MKKKKKLSEIGKYEIGLRERTKKAVSKLHKEFEKYNKLLNKKDFALKGSNIPRLPLTAFIDSGITIENTVKLKRLFPEIDPTNLPINEFKKRLKLINAAEKANVIGSELKVQIARTNKAVEAAELTKELKIYRNQKGKEWREELYKLGENEYKNNVILDKTKALKTAFENLPNKEEHRKEFDRYFDSIYEKFIKLVKP